MTLLSRSSVQADPRTWTHVTIAVDTEFEKADTLCVQIAARVPADRIFVKAYVADGVVVPSHLDLDQVLGDLGANMSNYILAVSNALVPI